jgi:hypothetical protein
LLKIAAAANKRVERINSPDINPKIPVINNNTIKTSLLMLIVIPQKWLLIYWWKFILLFYIF